MQKVYHIHCPKCNNYSSFYRYGKDPDGYQKYPACPVCGKATFLHHDHEHYSNYRCCDKHCNHSFFVWKNTVIAAPSMSSLFGKHDFKRMRYPVHLIITALSMFYLGKNSFRNISLILRTAFSVSVSHVTIRNWCTKFAPLVDDMRMQLLPLLDFNSDEWHADETVVKIAGVKHYLWFVIDSETRFVIGFHLSPHRDSPQAVSLLSEAVSHGKPGALVSDRYSAYKIPVKSILGVPHISVASFKDDISKEALNKSSAAGRRVFSARNAG